MTVAASTTHVPKPGPRPGKDAIGLSIDEFLVKARGHACDFHYDKYPKKLRQSDALQVLVQNGKVTQIL